MCITFKSEGIWTIEEDCSKSNSKEKEVQSFVLCVDQPIDCQQEEEERSYRRFVQVVIGIIILASSSFGFFGKKRCFHACFCTACLCFPCNNLCCGVVHELSSVWRLCIISKFKIRKLLLL